MISMPLAVKVALGSLAVVLSVALVVHFLATKRERTAEAQYPPSGRFIDVDGTTIHVKVMGQGSDIILIHGASGSLRDFTFGLVDRLSEDYRVIALDRPGLGWSNRPRGADSGGAAEPPRLQARLLQQAVEALNITRPIVVGHSYGGAVALAWALEHPDETAALVLLAAASNPWPGDLGALYRINSTLLGSAVVIPAITALAPNSIIESTTASIFAPQLTPDGYLNHLGPEMSLRRSTLRANAQQVMGLRPHIVEMSKHYPTLTLPVEILHGTDDTTVPLKIHSEPLARQIPGAVLTRLEGVGHMPHHADPEAVLAAIDRAATRAGLR